MTPEERKARNRQWRDLWALAERWESEDWGARFSRELKELLSAQGAPRPPGRPKRPLSVSRL